MVEYRLVKVVWKDIQGLDETWVITMLSSLSADKTFGGSVTSIPKGCVESIVLVSEASECFDEKI